MPKSIVPAEEDALSADTSPRRFIQVVVVLERGVRCPAGPDPNEAEYRIVRAQNTFLDGVQPFEVLLEGATDL